MTVNRALAINLTLQLACIVDSTFAQSDNTSDTALQSGYSAYQQGDYPKVLEYFSQVTAQGNAEAQYSLGMFYYDGSSVSQDYDKAREWWENLRHKAMLMHNTKGNRLSR